jgi:hypothetical protein
MWQGTRVLAEGWAKFVSTVAPASKRGRSWRTEALTKKKGPTGYGRASLGPRARNYSGTAQCGCG